MSSVTTSPRILWLQVCGLAAVQGAIALTWVIYNLYLLKLLTQFGFPKELATGVLILAGMGVALGFRLMMQTFPQILTSQVPEANKGLILGGIFVALALTAIPAGNLASRLGNRQAMMYGLVAMAGFTALMVLAHNGAIAAGIAIALGGTFSLVSNGTIPFALSMVPPDKAGLGTGIYFSGGAVASSVFGAVFSQPNSLTPIVAALIASAAFLAAAVFVASSGKLEAEN